MRDTADIVLLVDRALDRAGDATLLSQARCVDDLLDLYAAVGASGPLATALAASLTAFSRVNLVRGDEFRAALREIAVLTELMSLEDLSAPGDGEVALGRAA